MAYAIWKIIQSRKKKKEGEERKVISEEEELEKIAEDLHARNAEEVLRLLDLFKERSWESKRLRPSVFYRVLEHVEREEGGEIQHKRTRLTPLAYKVVKEIAKARGEHFWDIRHPNLGIIDSVAYAFPHLVGGDDVVQGAIAGDKESIERLVDNILSNPKFWKVVKDLLTAMATKTHFIVDGQIVVPKRYVRLADKVLAPADPDTDLNEDVVRETIDLIDSKILPLVIKRYKEKQKQAAAAAGGVAGAKVIKPPKAVNNILVKLENIRESAEWMGGVDVRALKKLLYDLKEGKKIVEKTFELLGRWEAGDTEAFFEGMEHVKQVVDHELDRYKLIGDVELMRRKFVKKELDAADISALLATLHTTYSLAENHISEFFSRVEEHSKVVGGGRLMIRPEHLEKHVIESLGEKFKRLRTVIRGNIEI